MAVFKMTNIFSYWAASPPNLESRLDMEIDRCAGRVIYSTVCEGLKDLVVGSALAHVRMTKLGSFFKKGGLTAQYALFRSLIARTFNPLSVDLLTHVNDIHEGFKRLESKDFTFTRENLIGMFYQLGAPATGDYGMDAVNTQLDAQTHLTNQPVTSEEVQAMMQANITSRKKALGIEGNIQALAIAGPHSSTGMKCNHTGWTAITTYHIH